MPESTIFPSQGLRIRLQIRQLTRIILCVAGLSYWTTTDPGPAGQMVHSPHRGVGRPQKQCMYQPSYRHIGQGAFPISIGMDNYSSEFHSHSMYAMPQIYNKNTVLLLLSRLVFFANQGSETLPWTHVILQCTYTMYSLQLLYNSKYLS